MDFKEVFIRYKEGKVNKEEKQWIEEELEKNEIIRDYLEEQMDLELKENHLGEASTPIDTGKVSKAVNRKFYRMIGISVGIMVGIVLLLKYIAMPAYDRFFYNPNEGYESPYGDWGQFFIDTSTFVELHFPEYRVVHAVAESQGMGNYGIDIEQQAIFTQTQELYSSKIIRGEDQTRSNDFWRFPVANAFYDKGGMAVSYVDEEGVQTHNQSEEDRAYYMEELDLLPKASRVLAYFSFKEDLTMEQLVEMQKENERLYFDWVAVRASDETYFNLTVGFDPGGSGVVLEKKSSPDGTYPCFELANCQRIGNSFAPEDLSNHFKSLVNYMSSRGKFLEALCNVNGIGKEKYKEMLDYIEKNGVKTYGVLVEGAVEDILAFEKQELVNSIYVDNVKTSKFSK